MHSATRHPPPATRHRLAGFRLQNLQRHYKLESSQYSPRAYNLIWKSHGRTI